MEDVCFNAVFNEDLDDDYENIMDRVVDHINYHGGDDNNGLGGDGYDGENNDDNDDSDEDDESFWRREFDRKKLVVCIARVINMYYINYIHKESCMVSYHTCMCWLTEVLRGHWKQCVNMFRMDTSTLLSLCSDLETKYELKTFEKNECY